MLKIFSMIRDFFSSLFSLNKKESEKRVQLRKIHRELQRHRARFFKPQSNEVLPEFAGILFKFATYARLLKDLFEKTIFHENTRLAEMYKDYLVESKLDEASKAHKADFAFSSMSQRLQASTSFSETLQEITKEFETYLALFRQPEFANFDREFTQLERLAVLSRHDFEKLLSFFDPEVCLNKSDHPPDFAPAHGQHLTQDLMDFYFSIARLHIDQSVVNNTLLLYSRVRKDASQKEFGKLKGILNMLDSLQKDYLSPEIILALLRAVNDDPALTITTDREIHTFLEIYRSRILSRFELDREKLIREHSEQAVTFSLKTLFGSAEVLPIQGFTDELNQLLAGEGFPGFTHVKPLAILKTFLVSLFEKSIKSNCQELLFNAFFENKAFKDKFVTLFHDVQEALERLTAFENSLNEPNEVSLLTLKTYLDKNRSGKGVGASLTNLVETINQNTSRLVGELTNLFADFNAELSLLLADAKQHTPLIVSNIRVIGGEQNARFLANLAASRENISMFIGIMRHFTIILKSLEREGDTTAGVR